MTAQDAILTRPTPFPGIPERTIAAGASLMEALPMLLDAPGRLLGVCRDDEMLGVITADSMLEALGRFIAGRDDCSVIELDCAPADFSASSIAIAVEDADTHLVDLLSRPAPDGRLRVTLRVRDTDPSAVIASLERHGYLIAECAARSNASAEVLSERIAALQALLNV